MAGISAPLAAATRADPALSTVELSWVGQPTDPPLPIMFMIGEYYTRDEIHGVLGGSKVSCLPSVNGKLVAACLTLSFSPAAPSVVLCGQGPKTTPVSKLLTLQRKKLPIFITKAPGRWQFRGEFRVAEFLVGGPRFEEFITGSGRSLASVSYVVLLRPS